jgi:MFS family permease
VNPAAPLLTRARTGFRDRGVNRSQAALLLALAIDNIGSGLFLPLGLVYATRVVGLSVDVAGIAVAVGTALGFVVPPLAARLNHRLGPRPVVVLSQLVQAAGAVAYLLAGSALGVFAGAALISMGTQLFYCSVFVLVADVTRSEDKERPFALVAMVRSGAFGLGTLIAAVALSWDSVGALRWLVGGDLVSFLVAAGVLAAFVVVPPVVHEERAHAGPRTVARDNVYVRLMLATLLIGLSTDIALIGMPVYVLDVLEGPTWLPGALLAMATALSSVAGVWVVDRMRPYRRTRVMQAGAGLIGVWALMTLAMLWLPSGVVLVVFAFVAWVVWVAGNKVFYPVAGALSEAVPPRASRDGYMAIYQYAFTAGQALCPAVIALFAVSDSLPWIVVVACSLAAIAAVASMSRRLPEHLDHRTAPAAELSDAESAIAL